MVLRAFLERWVGRLWSAAAWLAVALLVVPVAASAQDTAPTPVPLAEFWGELTGDEPVLPRDEPAAPLAEPAGTKAAPVAAFFGEHPDIDAPPERTVLAAGPVNLFVAVHRTGAQRHSDFFLTNGKPRRRPLATSIRLRRADDANFTNRTRFLARRVDEMGRPVNRPQLGVATTGEEFLAALVEASRRAPIGNLVIYGHAASTALFGREDRGFYASVMEVAKVSKIVSGEDIEKDEQLRLAGARDLSDFEWLVARGDIRFARNASIVFAGCGVAGKRDVEPNGIAARVAEITGAKVLASIDVTDQSMARGRDFRNKEYSRRTWVRFMGGQTPERLNTKVIDALKEMNLGGEVVAAVKTPPTDCGIESEIRMAGTCPAISFHELHRAYLRREIGAYSRRVAPV